MGKAFTARVMELKGDPNTPESAQQIIIFPGGSVEVTRTTTGEYWVHVAVNKKEILAETIEQSKHGSIVEARLDYPPGCPDLEILDLDNLQHLAVKVGTY